MRGALRIQPVRAAFGSDYTMRRRNHWIAGAAAVLIALLGVADPLGPALAQQPPTKKESPEPQQPIRVQVELVNLFATVRGKSKRLLPNLTKDNFRVFEDGQEQKIEFFSKETALPITLGVLIDTSISVERILGAEQFAASRFLQRVMRKGDLAFVASFDINVDLLSDLTEDHGRLERGVQGARVNAPVEYGPIQRGPRGTALYDAIYLACREKLAREAGRKALVILTDAVDAGSKVSLREAIETAQRTDTVIHILGLIDTAFYAGRRFGYDGEGTAKKLAEETGGRSLFLRDEKKLDEAFDQITEELRSQYTLGYYPTNPNRDGKFRKIKIETTSPGTKVLARKGYYAAKN